MILTLGYLGMYSKLNTKKALKSDLICNTVTQLLLRFQQLEKIQNISFKALSNSTTQLWYKLPRESKKMN